MDYSPTEPDSADTRWDSITNSYGDPSFGMSESAMGSVMSMEKAPRKYDKRECGRWCTHSNCNMPQHTACALRDTPACVRLDGIRANMSVHSTHTPTTLGKYGRAITREDPVGSAREL